MNTDATAQRSGTRSFAPYWLALLPALAVVAGFFTLYLTIRYPDREIKVQPVTEIHDAGATHQHVVNSVTPPLH